MSAHSPRGTMAALPPHQALAVATHRQRIYFPLGLLRQPTTLPVGEDGAEMRVAGFAPYRRSQRRLAVGIRGLPVLRARRRDCAAASLASSEWVFAQSPHSAAAAR